MDFKSHEEVVLPAGEAAKKRAKPKARTQNPARAPRVREVRIPPDEANISSAAASVSSASHSSAHPQVPVREVRLRASASDVEDAAG